MRQESNKTLSSDIEHGQRGGGSLHTVATKDNAGFMSAADKVKLDGLANETITQGQVTTSDAVATTILTIPIALNTAETIAVTITGKRSGATGASTYVLHIGVENQDGVLALTVGVASTFAGEINPATNANAIISSTNILVQVTGIALQTYKWWAVARRLVATT